MKRRIGIGFLTLVALLGIPILTTSALLPANAVTCVPYTEDPVYTSASHAYIQGRGTAVCSDPYSNYEFSYLTNLLGASLQNIGDSSSGWQTVPNGAWVSSNPHSCAGTTARQYTTQIGWRWRVKGGTWSTPDYWHGNWVTKNCGY